MSAPKPLLAFYGATGGCTLAALAPALKAGYECTALARTPSKLESMLKEKDVPVETISSHLHITQGDINDLTAVKGPLTMQGRPADTIFSGIGIYAMFAKEVTICTDGMNQILTALRELKPATRPLIVAISTTGLTKGGEKRDIGLLVVPLYHWLLGKLHADKAGMEEAVEREAGKGEGESVIRGFTIMKPSLLTDGKMQREKVRVGTTEEPAVGYTVSRSDVGQWMFENLIEKEAGPWVGKKVSITY